MPLLSIIVPAYNEAKTIRDILEKINRVAIDKEIIVINNGSSDDTENILRDIKYDNLKVIHCITNIGKGGACLTGLSCARGEFVIFQDADLEYDPNDYFKLMAELQRDRADIVLGARFTKGYQGLLWHRFGNRVLTGFLNLLFGCRLNDYATCYKLARKTTLDALNLRARGFDLDVEIVCNALKKNLRITEVPVSYKPRSHKEGKKIRFKDALITIFHMLKYRLRG